MGEYKQVTITETVPVSDRKTLAAWLNQELGRFADSVTHGKSTLGSKALDLIDEAGFKLTGPVVTRNPVEPRW